MIISWGGWTLDEAGHRLVTPRAVPLGAAHVGILGELIRAHGAVRSRRSLAVAIRDAGTRSEDVENMIGQTVFRINKLARFPKGVVNVRGFGYRLSPVDGIKDAIRVAGEEAFRTKIAALLADQFEATGPHARAVAAEICEMYDKRATA